MSSWAEVVKKSKSGKVGFDLNYVPPSDEAKVTILHEDVQSGVDKWKNSLVGMVLGFNPSYLAMKNFVAQKWSSKGEIQVSKLKSGIFTFLFQSEEQKNEILEQGPWLYYSKILLLKPWSPDVSLDGGMVRTIPIWIRLSNMKLHYFTPSVLSKLGSFIGVPLMVDTATANQMRLDFARICVEISPTCKFPASIPLVNELGVEERITVEYEWIPPTCGGCVQFGHSSAKCPKEPKEKKVAQIWKQKVDSSKRDGKQPVVETPMADLDASTSNTPVVIHSPAKELSREREGSSTTCLEIIPYVAEQPNEENLALMEQKEISSPLMVCIDGNMAEVEDSGVGNVFDASPSNVIMEGPNSFSIPQKHLKAFLKKAKKGGKGDKSHKSTPK